MKFFTFLKVLVIMVFVLNIEAKRAKPELKSFVIKLLTMKVKTIQKIWLKSLKKQLIP